jgi:uncharacterized membrane protein
LTLLSLSELIGRLHPALVHLPIGILMLAGLFLVLSANKKFLWLRSTINVILFIGMIGAILSCITGYLLSRSDDYDGWLVNVHQWMGISVAIISGVILFIRTRPALDKWQGVLGVLLLILLLFTGHQGGSLTHGEDYLSQPLDNLLGMDTQPVIKRKPIPDVQAAAAYADVIQPILQSKCYGCHSSSKQKGKLRMDQQALLMKGGKNGEVIVPGKAIESEMIKRILLPKNDKHHMAPKEKAQVTEEETALLQWWIDNGADFIKKVKDIPQPEKIKPVLLALQNEVEEKKTLSDVPATPIEKADEQAIQKLRDAGVVVLPVAANSNYLSVGFIIIADSGDVITKLLLPLKKQVIWLKMDDTKISDVSLEIIGQCSNLTRLRLNHTKITDKGLAHLAQLKQLQSLSLVGSSITANGITSLKDLKNLQSLYLYQSGVQQSDWPGLKRMFPGVNLDSGGYKLIFLETDTMKVKAPPKK